MRNVQLSLVTDLVASLCRICCYALPDEVIDKISTAISTENSALAQNLLTQLLDNARLAGEGVYPLCQDTGLAVVFIDLGQEVHLEGGDLYTAVNAGVAKGYIEGYLRKSVVMEPVFERKNTNDNTPAIIHLRLVPGDKIKVKVAPKGAGSENKGLLRMLPPSAGLEGVKQTVLEAVTLAGPDACPPLVVGVGIGGNMEMAAFYAKQAAVRELGRPNPDARYAALEQELLEIINQTGIGPLGLGGQTTALAVNIEWGPTHIASLPVAVNLNCHCARHWEGEI